MQESLRHYDTSTHVGVHLRYSQSLGGSQSIRFDLDRNLDLVQADNTLDYTRQFAKQVVKDFSLLAALLHSDPALARVEEIYSIGVFPEAIGRRFGFSSTVISAKEKIIIDFLNRTSKQQLRGNTHMIKPLRKFSISRDRFVARYFDQ